MNIFILSYDPDESARMNCDTHVVKICTEVTQVLSTAVQFLGGQGPYKPTHSKHPLTLWAQQHPINRIIFRDFGLALCREYTFRYMRKHACEKLLISMDLMVNLNCMYSPRAVIDSMPQCVHDSCKKPGDIVGAYRQYYLEHKQHLLKYTKREIPDWIPDGLGKHIELSRREMSL